MVAGFWGNIRVILGFYRGHIGIMENNMETTIEFRFEGLRFRIEGLGFGVPGLGFRV